MPIRKSTVPAFMTCLWILACAATPALAEHKPAASIPAADLIQPGDFAAALQRSRTPKPLILQVGFHKAYEQAHIPDAEYVGEADEEDGLKSLQTRVADLPKDSAIVIYCGCCPWRKCPNIAAAYDALRDLGFKNVKVIYFADDFGTNWVDMGYPTTKGS
jgi:rhodanese-related sulfurtransferase